MFIVYIESIISKILYQSSVQNIVLIKPSQLNRYINGNYFYILIAYDI